MAAAPTVLARALLAGTSGTLYTTPGSTTAIITSIVLANTSGSAVAATVAVNGVVLVPAVSLAANSVTSFDLRQPLAATQTITGFAGTASVVACHIGGVQVT